jgi:DNA primase
MTAPESGISRLVDAVAAAALFYRDQLGRDPAAQAYLRTRGLLALVARDRPWRAGFAPPGGQSAVEHLRSSGFNDDELVAAGLARRYGDRLSDVFRGRIVLPIRDGDGRPVGFIGRTPFAPGPDGPPKYLNSAETDLYRKGDLLYGLSEQASRLEAAGWRPLLVEGPLDVVGVWQSYTGSGPPGVVALSPCGTALTERQAHALWGLPAVQRHGLIVGVDADGGGDRALGRIWNVLGGPAASARLLCVQWPAGADPAELAATPAGRATLRYLLRLHTRPLVDRIIDQTIDRVLSRDPDRSPTPEAMVAAVRAVAPTLAQLSGPEAARLSKRVSDRLGAAPEVVTGEVYRSLRALDDSASLEPALATGSPFPRTAAPSVTETQVPPAAPAAPGFRRGRWTR